MAEIKGCVTRVTTWGYVACDGDGAPAKWRSGCLVAPRTKQAGQLESVAGKQTALMVTGHP
jgi:hypothetical protein